MGRIVIGDVEHNSAIYICIGKESVYKDSNDESYKYCDQIYIDNFLDGKFFKEMVAMKLLGTHFSKGHVPKTVNVE